MPSATNRRCNTYSPESGPAWGLLHQLDRSLRSLDNVERALQEMSDRAHAQLAFIAQWEADHEGEPLSAASPASESQRRTAA